MFVRLGHRLAFRSSAALLSVAKGPAGRATGSAAAAPPPPPPPPAAAPPPPPPPPTFGSGATAPRNVSGGAMPGSARSWRTPPEILEALMPFIPTFFVDADTVLREVPMPLHDMFGTLKFPQFLRKYRFYFDVRVNHGQAEVRLREGLVHPRRGVADPLYAVGMSRSDIHATIASASTAAAPGGAHNVTADVVGRGAAAGTPLLSYLYEQCPQTFTPLGDFLATVSKRVLSHPQFDASIGVVGILEANPQHFQIVDGELRRRPRGIAPLAIAEHDETTSPLPRVLSKVFTMLNSEACNAEGSAEISTLFAELSIAEKQGVKRECGSFPRFLRKHGRILHVTADNQRVVRFNAQKDIEEYAEPDSASASDGAAARSGSGRGGTSDLFNEVRNVPETMRDGVVSDVDWAVKELYDALPVMQAVELDELQHIVSDGVKNALPKNLEEALRAYPEYFSVWQYPDDESVTIVQRGKLTVPEYEDSELISILMPLIPQGGIAIDKLLRKAPLPVQRHLYRHGVKKRLNPLKDYFLVAGSKVMCVAE